MWWLMHYYEQSEFLVAPCCLQTYNWWSLYIALNECGQMTDWWTGRNVTRSTGGLLSYLPWRTKEYKKYLQGIWSQTRYCLNVSDNMLPPPHPAWFLPCPVLFLSVVKLARSLILLPWKFTFLSFDLWIKKHGKLFTGVNCHIVMILPIAVLAFHLLIKWCFNTQAHTFLIGLSFYVQRWNKFWEIPITYKIDSIINSAIWVCKHLRYYWHDIFIYENMSLTLQQWGSSCSGDVSCLNLEVGEILQRFH
jgi:hypothetical protein